jgi:catechol 2,3-dioxygenase-like lactoylglutathione lyase family enzyme
MITSVKFVSIPVKDQDRALKFYTGKLGFKLLSDQPFGIGIRWIELGMPGSPTRVVLFTPPGEEDRVGTLMNVSLSCDDLEATYQDLMEKGVEFSVPPTEEAWGKFCQFKDSEGNEFVLSAEEESEPVL